MNAVFTIVAKNYLSRARTLGDSIRNFYLDLPFHILLADETEGLLDLSIEKYPIFKGRDIGVPEYDDMAFKYSILEFSTAIKPFFFEYLFDRFQYEKIIYFDPDIFVYSSLDSIFAALDEHFMILTPHLTKISMTDKGIVPENNFLNNGTYNLGFVAFDHSSKARAVLQWWKTRVNYKGYIDRTEGLFTDQKWMNLVTCFEDKGILVLRNPGYNVAHWNMHERPLSFVRDRYLVDGWPLVFFHFSGFDPHQPNKASRLGDAIKFNPTNSPDYRKLFTEYADRLICNQSPKMAHVYAYDKFENGVRIFSFQRRLYRSLTEAGFKFDYPFSTTPGSFYDLLRKNRLLIFDMDISGEYGKKDFSNADRKLKFMKLGMLLLKKVMGIKYFHLLTRTLLVLCQPEEQTYLLETLKLDLPIRFR